MRTRAEIYGNEAATLLRTVTMYPGLSQQQLLCFHPGKFADGELYEVAYVAHGQEALVCHALRGNKGGSRRIIVVDSPTQIAKIDCPDISGFCTVSQDGQTQYFKKAGGT